MIRITKQKPSGNCTLPMYIGFLISGSKANTCTHLAGICGVSHDSINRFLLREAYEPKDLFNEAKKYLNIEGGIISVDDSVLDKPYSKYINFVSWFWSGKHHRAVRGINLITLYYTDCEGKQSPINYRVVDKAENKTKNDYFKEMLEEVIEWGVKPLFVTGDSWYSCEKNLKLIKDHQIGFMFAIKSNRTISTERGIEKQVKEIEDISVNGVECWLCGFGCVKIFRTNFKDKIRHYIIWLPEEKHNLYKLDDFKKVHNTHWRIEEYHRMIKQVLHIESFQVRGKRLILNHIFASLCGYIYLHKMKTERVISSIYKWKRELYNSIVCFFIEAFTADKGDLCTQFYKNV